MAAIVEMGTIYVSQKKRGVAINKTLNSGKGDYLRRNFTKNSN